jgi:YegS/Rv2252/BmrU family lipid kinase
MMEKIKIKFIINPISGGKNKAGIEKLIYEAFCSDNYSVDIQYTQYQRHATEIASKSVSDGFNQVVAVGGDGTVNEVAKALIGSDVEFGIVPMGSGNGLSRFLNIPFKPELAFNVIKKRRIFAIDTIKINDEYFVNVAGFGFDAHIAHLFSTYGKRGFVSYIKLIFKEFFKYKDDNYSLIIDGKTLNINAFLVSFANSSQFGNNAHIAPLAEINDGLIDICILKKFPWWKTFIIVILLYTKGLSKSKYYNVIKAPSLKIINTKSLKGHIDGDPIVFNADVDIEILPLSLKVIQP